MNISLSMQQALEIAEFLNVPSKEFRDLKEVKLLTPFRQKFQEITKDYKKVFTDLAEEAKKIQETYIEKFQEFTKSDPKPSDSDIQAKQKEMSKELDGVCKPINDKSEAHAKTEGTKMVNIEKLDANQFTAFKAFFERKAQQFQLWQDAQKLSEISELIEAL